MANGYKKIAGGAKAGRLAVTTMSLWQGPDHLLQIERDGYTENYKRFYFSDIEIFTVRLDNRRRNLAIMFGILVAFFVVVSLWANVGFMFVFAGIFLMPFIYNMVRGPSCVVYVTTAVQREQLASVGRVRGAMKLLQVIRDAAAQTQGVLAPDMVRVKVELQNMPPGMAPPPMPMPTIPGPVPDPDTTPLQPAEAPPEPPPTQ